ncbi:unnamed protein product [Aureobasidium vineae]|uniref:DUF6604 domain-containing protein n=1 Tax=Aureobasidium vineae TaxID=2773715 RepID=A0A9N8J7E7_9PEZI|nr:unnamed protein product [Aureobasidium vineae]
MSDHNTYLACNGQTRYILWWLCHTSNAILQSMPQGQNNDSEVVVNTTGQVTSKELVSMARMVASRLSQQQIPSTIFRLFQSVISARSSSHAAYVEMASNYENEDMEESNRTHKHFIDRLLEAFEVLGGSEWISSTENGTVEPQSYEEIEEVVFSNAFSALKIHHCTDDLSDDETGSETSPTAKHPRKTRKTKRKQQSRQKKNGLPRTANHPDTLDVPLENFCIVDGPEGDSADYRMALESVFVEWWKLRQHIQLIWLNVAYEGANIAVAGALSEMAIAMVKKTALAVFLEFPAGFDTWRAMTREVQGGDHEHESSFDLGYREASALHTYQDLLDFLIDYQKNRTGRPTKRMQAKLSGWDPCFNLQEASMQERIAWRRSYTINWLYDLVNVFSHIVLQENNISDECRAYETIEWSVKTPYHRPRKLYGMECFAELITTLAMQKPGSDVQSKILSHHVFQLQCMVDSFTTSHGWAPGLRKDHGNYTKPFPGKSPSMDCLKLFLGTHDSEFLSGVGALSDRLKDYQRLSDDRSVPFRITQILLDRFKVQTGDWLGNSERVFTSEVPSRFSSVARNGLWDYSPFLSGVGLVEALEISYRLTMLAWDTIPELLSLLRLQYLLLQKGYMRRSDELVSFLIHNAASSSEVKKSKSSSLASVEESRRRSSRVAKYTQHDTETAIGAAQDMQHVLSVDGNIIFRRKSHLLVYRESGWDTARVVQSKDSAESVLSSFSTVWARDKSNNDSEGDPFLRLYRENASRFNSVFASGSSSSTLDTSEITASSQRLGHSEYGPGGLRQLVLAEWDIVNDICDKIPLSGLDYMWITMKIMDIFEAVEKSLESMSVEKFLYWGRRDHRWISRIGYEKIWPNRSEAVEEEELVEEKESHLKIEEDKTEKVKQESNA